MRVLAISGSLRRDSHNTRLLRAAAEVAAATRRARALRRTEGRPALRRGRRQRSGARGRAAPAGGDRRRRRGPDRDPRVQLVDPRPAQERARLGLAPVSRQRASQQAGRRDRRQHRHVRRRLGPGRGAQGAGRHRGPRGRSRAPGAGAEEAFAGDRLADEELHRRLGQILAELVEAVEDRYLLAA